MNRRDIVIGVLIVFLLAGAVYLSQRKSEDDILVIPENTSAGEDFGDRFQVNIPEGSEKINLKDVTGGDAQGLAARKYSDNVFEFNIVADLPELPDSEIYQGWLVKGEEGRDDYSLVSAGVLSMSKGGWILSFKTDSDLNGYSKVWVTQEKMVDKNPETKILEGSF